MANTDNTLTDEQAKEIAQKWHNSITKREAEAKETYFRQQKEDEGKTYMEILPSDFRTFKRSIIRQSVLWYVDRFYDFLMEHPEIVADMELYEYRKVDVPVVVNKETIVRSMMAGRKNYDFILAELYMPKIDRLENRKYMSFMRDWKDEHGTLDKGFDTFEKENEGYLENLRKAAHLQALMEQTYDQYMDMICLKKGGVANDYDFKDGLPGTGRGCMCAYYHPIVGGLSDDELNVTFIVHNPRSKKDIVLTMVEQIENTNCYRAVGNDGKTYFVVDYQDVANSWDGLFSSNKEVYSGWWNRKLIRK